VGHNLPADGVREEQMGEHFPHIPQFIGIQTMNSIVCVPKDLLERWYVSFIYLTKPLKIKVMREERFLTQIIKMEVRFDCQYLCQEPEEFLVGPLLGAAIQNHVTQFRFLPRFHLHFHHFVSTLIVIQTALNC